MILILLSRNSHRIQINGGEVTLFDKIQEGTIVDHQVLPVDETWVSADTQGIIVYDSAQAAYEDAERTGVAILVHNHQVITMYLG